MSSIERVESVFVLTDDGRLVNLDHAKDVYLSEVGDGTVVIMADGDQISDPVTAEQGHLGLGRILGQERNLIRVKDKNFERHLRKEQTEMIAHSLSRAINGIVRYLEWRDRQKWHYRLWRWMTRPFGGTRWEPTRHRKFV